MTKREKHKIAEELKRIKKEKGLTASNVVDEAKDKKNPLHKHFEWDDKKAGRKYREHQARMLILNVEVEKVEDTDISRHINVSVSKDNGEKEREYKTTVEVSENESWKKQILKQAISRIKHWQTKYKHLQELSPIFRGIDKVEENIEEDDEEEKKEKVKA